MTAKHHSVMKKQYILVNFPNEKWSKLQNYYKILDFKYKSSQYCYEQDWAVPRHC